MTTSQSDTKAGGACSRHGVYEGQHCPVCAKNTVQARLRQATWEATQWMADDEIVCYVDAVLDEVASDAP